MTAVFFFSFLFFFGVGEWSLTLGLAPPFWIWRLLPCIPGEFSQKLYSWRHVKTRGDYWGRGWLLPIKQLLDKVFRDIQNYQGRGSVINWSRRLRLITSIIVLLYCVHWKSQRKHRQQWRPGTVPHINLCKPLANRVFSIFFEFCSFIFLEVLLEHLLLSRTFLCSQHRYLLQIFQFPAQ